MLGILLTVACLAGTPEKNATPADEAQATLHRVAQLPAAQQRDWLRHLEQRFNWASQITMPADEAHSEELRIEKLLRRPNIAWADLLDLMQKTDQREKNAVAKLVRQYRKAVYNRYQTQPREMQERQEAWYRVWSAWEAAGRPVSQQDRLLDWLAEAIGNTTKETNNRLPADPKFGPAGGDGATASQLAAGKAAVRPRLPPAPPAPPRNDDQVADRPMMLWRPHVPLDDRLPDRLADAAPPAVEIDVLAPRRMTFDADAIARVDGPVAIRLPRHSLAEDAEAIAAVPPMQELAMARHDFGVQIKFEGPPAASVADRSATEVAATTPESSGHAEVNVEELTSRIAGINLSLRTLEGELSVKRTWSVDQLDGLVQRLDILILRQKDLSLFRDLISPAQRAKAGAIDSPKAAIAAIVTHVSELRVHYQTTAPAADDSQRAGNLHQLESLAERLSALSADVP